VRPITIRIVTAVAVCLAGLGLVAAQAADKKPVQRDLSKDYDDLTPSEHIAIRAAAKAAYKAKKLKVLHVCADPGNMPLSNIKREGFQNKVAELLAKSMGARLEYHWRPFIERGLTRETFDQAMCDVMIDVPANYGRLLTTFPVYKTPYVLVFRNDKGLDITGLDDPKLKDLKIGVFQTSGIRMALAKRGIVNNLQLQTQTHDGDLVPENQPWYVVQRMLNGEFDVAAVFGPFAGWVKTMKNEPVTILPVNMMEDEVPLEFELALGVRRTDAFLKYMLEFALEDHEEEIGKILEDYGVPLVQCSKCIVPGDLPAHGSYTQVAQTEYKARPDLASPDQVVTKEKLEGWLADGADLTQELANAVVANDPERVKFLVEKGADVNKVDNQGGTPLTNAARQRKNELVELLIKLGADVNKPNGNGMTALVTAVMRDHVPTVKVLLANGADIEEPGPEGYRPLAIAIAEDKYEVAKALMEAGADVNVPADPDGLTPLMVAVAQNAPAEGAMFLPSSTRPLEIAKGLIERGADVNAKSKSGTTALMVAATHNNPPMIGLLIESGADTEAKNNQGKTAAEVAELNKHMEAAQAIRVLAAAKSASSAPAAPGSGQGTSSQ
jgi:quinoprotein dehydrogenase-associated probable ABC transporter substrate-binding protein